MPVVAGGLKESTGDSCSGDGGTMDPRYQIGGSMNIAWFVDRRYDDRRSMTPSSGGISAREEGTNVKLRNARSGRRARSADSKSGGIELMIKLVIARLITLPFLLLSVLSVVFILGELSPVDPATRILGDDPTDAQVAAVRAQLGLDRPAGVRFWDWLSHALTGDLGESHFTGAKVGNSIWQAAPVTLSLTIGALVVAVAVGVSAGIVAALRAGRATDRMLSTIATAGQAMPSFWLGLLLIFAFALELRWFPAVGYIGPSVSPVDWLRSVVLPSLSLGLIAAASLARQTRSAMIGVLQQDYIRTALAKGLPRRKVVVKHALKNAGAPVLTVLAFQVSALLSGSIVIERLFAMPGLGTLAINAVMGNDTNMIQGFVLVTVAVVVIVNVLLDLAYTWLNPKVRPA
jgi:peptide/nickel transport system permease protein